MYYPMPGDSRTGILDGLTLACDSDLPGGTDISRRIYGHETDKESDHANMNQGEPGTASTENHYFYLD